MLALIQNWHFPLAAFLNATHVQHASNVSGLATVVYSKAAASSKH